MGVPGSGKTTYLKRLAEERGYIYINKDDIRAEMLGDVNDQSKNREVWLESERRITEALRSDKSIVLDATYAERWKREELVRSLRRRGANRVLGAYFDVSYERAVAQNLKRERVVDDKSMTWFRAQFQKEPPILEEGFDRIYTFDELEMLEDELLKA
jgi:predicted kinase